MLFKLRGMEKDEILLEIQKITSKNLKVKKSSKKSSRKSSKSKKTSKFEEIPIETPALTHFLKPKANIREKITFLIEKTNVEETILGRLSEPNEIEKKEDFQDAMEDIYKIAGDYIRKIME